MDYSVYGTVSYPRKRIIIIHGTSKIVGLNVQQVSRHLDDRGELEHPCLDPAGKDHVRNSTILF